MFRWTLIAAFVSGLLGVGEAKRSLPLTNTGARKVDIQRVMRQVQNGRFVAAEKTARNILANNPSAVGVQALLGVALVRRGKYADGLVELEQTWGVMAYTESGGIAAHADARRAAGRGREAWTVREARLHGMVGERERVRIYNQGMDDYLSEGRTDEAISLGWDALSIHPDAPSTHAFLSTAYLMSGDTDSAGFHHWMSMKNEHVRSPRAAVNDAWLGEAHNDVAGGLLAWERVNHVRRSKARMAAWHGGWLRRNGRVSEARGIVFDSVWSDHQDPDLYAEQIRLLHALGEPVLAIEGLGQLVELYPEHPYIHNLEQLLSE